MPEISFELKIRNKIMNATVQLPEGEVRPAELLPILHGYSNALVGAFIPDGAAVSCKAGCGACCRQLVPISESEALYLAALIDQMPEDRKKVVLARFAEIVSRMHESGMMKALGECALEDAARRRELGMQYFDFKLACPFLEDESCSIHEHRPFSCREYLVTSPAVHCVAPSAETIRTVEMPKRLSYTMFRFSDGEGNSPVNIIPMPLLLEFAAKNRVEDQPAMPAPQMFENFFRESLK